jgi:hypothetical protein
VGGSGNGHSGIHGGNGRGARREQVVAHKALALPAKTAGKQSAAHGKAFKKTATPEEVIPMNEGEFKDF